MGPVNIVLKWIFIFIQISWNSSENFSKNESEDTLSSDNKTDILLQYYCRSKGTCDQNVDKDIPVCYCDEACITFNDCCSEVIQSTMDTDDKNTFNELTSKMPFVSCEPHHLNMFQIGAGTGSYFISKCPADYPWQELFEKCDNGDVFPVNTRDGIVYKNVYCAYCHGIRDYTVWEFRFTYTRDCNTDTVAAFNESNINSRIKFIQSRGCQYYFRPSSFKAVRFCYLYNEPATNDTLKQELCEAFANPVYSSYQNPRKYYRNIFCVDTMKDRFPGCARAVSLTDQRGFKSTTLTGIFKVRPVVEVSGQTICHDGEYYNDLSDSCRSKTCSKTEDDDNDKCTIEFMKYVVWETNKVSLITDDVVDKNFVTRAVIFFYISLPHERYNLGTEKITGKLVCDKSSTYSGGGCCIFDGFARFIMQNEQTQKNIDDFIRTTERIEWKYKEIFQGKAVTARHFESGKTNDTCISNGNDVTDKPYRVGGVGFDSDKKSFVYDNSGRSKSEVPISFEGTAYVNEDGGEVKIKKWKFLYRSVDGVTSRASSPNEWSSATVMIYVIMLISCISVL